ncbi:MAG TPA: sn-glycerol-1-phosphate dehydrogenase [Chloroflexi bacterium]|nr:sn-glycerol-1-phosphate dehydrogenase [Chloroflexota bacterium]HHW87610.1 sn-glycerol-1-phosphate dehydrogenase [Chloroflexota bacterium]
MHYAKPNPVVVANDALEQLVGYCQQQQLTQFLIVADANTDAVLGNKVEVALQGAGCDVHKVILRGQEVVADAERVYQVLLALDGAPRTLIAAGAGTITDITRFVSHRMGLPFLATPSAPSVDGFASVGAPMLIDGVKISLPTHAPAAIFADLDVLAQAPRAMIAAGFADILGKFTSVADFRLGHLVRDERYDATIAQRTYAVAKLCADNADAIGQATPESIRLLMAALIESGICILDFGDSASASGSEHHLSHFWEMLLLREGRPAILHGAKVGVATVMMAELYAQVRHLTRAEVAERLEAAELPARAAEMAAIQAAFGAEAEAVARHHRAFLDMTPVTYAAIKRRVLDHWDEIQAIAAQVPPPAEIARLLTVVGGPTTPAELGLSDAEATLALDNGHYLRNRFTVRKLARMLGVRG